MTRVLSSLTLISLLLAVAGCTATCRGDSCSRPQRQLRRRLLQRLQPYGFRLKRPWLIGKGHTEPNTTDSKWQVRSQVGNLRQQLPRVVLHQPFLGLHAPPLCSPAQQHVAARNPRVIKHQVSLCAATDTPLLAKQRQGRTLLRINDSQLLNTPLKCPQLCSPSSNVRNLAPGIDEACAAISSAKARRITLSPAANCSPPYTLSMACIMVARDWRTTTLA